MLSLFMIARTILAGYGLVTLALLFWQQLSRRNQEKTHVELIAERAKAAEEFRRSSSLRLTEELLDRAFIFNFDTKRVPTEQQLYLTIYCWTVEERRDLASYLTDVPEYLHQLPVPPRLQEILGADGRPWWDQKKLELLWSQDVPEHAVQSSVVVPSENGVDVSAAATDVRRVDESRASNSIAGDRSLDGSGCDENWH